MLRATARLSADRQRIEVLFPYSPEAVNAIKGNRYEAGVPGARWSPSKRVWTVPLELTSGERLREAFGAGLILERSLRIWGRAERRRLASLLALSQAKDATLGVLPGVLPHLYELLGNRPYQKADIKRMVEGGTLNANEPGTGKTFEIIGTAAEAGLLDWPAVTLAPVRAIENTWAEELRRARYPHPIFASEDPRQRVRDLAEAAKLAERAEPFWMVANPDMLRVKPIPPKDAEKEVAVTDPVTGAPFWAPRPEFFDIPWGVVAVDEFHKFGLTNPRSQFGLAVRLLAGELLILASGTPMGGKYKRLHAALNFLDPETYGAWWRWAEQWLVIESIRVGDRQYKNVIDEIQPGREQDFQAAHAFHFIRRTKLADLPGCPPQVHRTDLCGMTKQQERQYRTFEREAEIRINAKRITGHGVLAEWTRLRSFANATCRVSERKLIATPDSGKLPALLDVLDEVGIRKRQPEPGARALVGSMDKSFVNITAALLRESGIECDTLTGDTKDSKPIIKRFRSKDPKPYVIVMTIQTGGVSLNLEEARAAIALDESWDPDDTTQFFERGDRGTRTTPLLCVRMRTRETIQEYIADVAGGKEINNRNAYKFAAALRARAERADSSSI